MPTRSYVGRFAPSPTGRMHFGIARTFLAAWLDARAHGGRIILRIEDLDLPRVVPGADAELMRDLEWLGLVWDEGPAAEGLTGPYYQSQRSDHYLRALERLERLGRIYPCTCSRKEIGLASSAPHGVGDEGPRYPGTCRDPTRRRSDRTPAIRFGTRPFDVVEHVDRLFGALRQDVHAEVGDFVVRRSDGLWAYQLAVTVDDLEQGVSCIVRGSDLLASTARQLLLRRVLDASAPPLDTLHVPLVRGKDQKRLAKRDGSAGIASRRERGEPPEAVVGELAASLGLVPRGTLARAADLVSHWSVERLPRSEVIFEDEFDGERPMP